MATLASDVDVLDEIITITDKGRESLEDKGSARNYASQLPVPKGYKLLILAGRTVK